MKSNTSLQLTRKFVILAFMLFCSIGTYAQLNSDGSYALKGENGKTMIYYPAHPGAGYKHIDTLAVPRSNGKPDLYFRVSENNVVFQSPVPQKQSYSESHPVIPPGRDVIIDTLEIEMPDGSFKQYYSERKSK